MTKHDADRKVKILDFIAATLRTRGVPSPRHAPSD